MNTFDLLKELKSRFEATAQIDESATIVSEISGNQKESRAVVMREIEGRVQMIEVSARLLDGFAAR